MTRTSFIGRLLVGLILLCCVVGVAAAADANVITNPGFESNSGSIDGWTSALDPTYNQGLAASWEVSPYVVQSGSYSAYMTRSSGHASDAVAYLYQTIDTRNANSITGYVKNEGFGQNFRVWIDGSLEVHYGTSGYGWAQWTITLDEAQKKSGTVLKISVGYSSGQYGAYYVDTHVCNVPEPTANFTANVTSGVAPLSVAFTSTATNATEYTWYLEYPDGYRTAQNPTHTYTTAGTYTVRHTAINQVGTATETKNNYITVTEGMTADFSANVTSGNEPLSVAFTDSSTGTPTAWSWTFGDGNSSALQNPTHTYASHGVYTVSLNASNSYNYDIESKSNYITVYEVVPYSGNAVAVTTYDAAGTILPGVSLTLTNTGTSASALGETSVLGFYLFDNVSDGTYTVTAKKSNYLDAYTDPFDLSGSTYKVQTFYMTAFGSTAAGGIGVQYPPHLVRFVVTDWRGTPVSNLHVAATGYETTAGAWDWLTELFGIPTGAPIANETMSGYTGTDGAISFTMVETVKYSMAFGLPGEDIFFRYYVYPKESEYTLQIPRTDGTVVRDILFSTSVSEHNATHTNITGYLTVDSTEINNYYIQLYDEDMTLITSVTRSLGGATTEGNATFQVPTVAGAAYYVRGTLETLSTDAYDQIRAITIRGRIIDLGIDAIWYQWISIVLIIAIGALFTGSSMKLGAVVVPLVGAFFWWIGWLEVSVLLLSVAVVFGILLYIRKSEGGG